MGGLNHGGQPHLLDSARIVVEEWDKISPPQLANCWLKADVFPREAAAEVRRPVHGLEPLFDGIHTDVSELVSMMANSSLSEESTGVSADDRSSAVRRWLAVEDDAAVVIGAFD